MLDLVTGRGGDPQRETDMEGMLNLINNSESHGFNYEESSKDFVKRSILNKILHMALHVH